VFEGGGCWARENNQKSRERAALRTMKYVRRGGGGGGVGTKKGKGQEKGGGKGWGGGTAGILLGTRKRGG